MKCSDRSSSRRNNWNWTMCWEELRGWAEYIPSLPCHREVREILVCLTKWNESYVGYGLHLQTQEGINRREAEPCNKGRCWHEDNRISATPDKIFLQKFGEYPPVGACGFWNTQWQQRGVGKCCRNFEEFV